MRLNQLSRIERLESAVSPRDHYKPLPMRPGELVASAIARLGEVEPGAILIPVEERRPMEGAR